MIASIMSPLFISRAHLLQQMDQHTYVIYRRFRDMTFLTFVFENYCTGY